MSERRIDTRYYPATSQYGSHMGTCHHFPAMAEARSSGGSRVEITAEQYPDLEPAQLVAKARAILLQQIGRAS